MNTPNNRRRKESVQKIETVFVQLLQARELEQISVSDICKRAGLNRSTFYANYADIYELAASMRDKLEDSVAQLYQLEIAQSFNSNDYLKLFRHIRENQMLYRTYFKLGYDREDRASAYDCALAQQHFQNRFLKYHIEFFKSGLNRIIKMWLESGCQETPEEMAEIIHSEYRGREK